MTEGKKGEYTGKNVSYYTVEIKDPKRYDPYTAECEDIIEALGMSFAEGCAFKAIWRRCAARTLGKHKAGYKGGFYDAEKVIYYGERMVAQDQRADGLSTGKYFADIGAAPAGFIKPDTEHQVFFYEQDFYVLSNFSAFNLIWKGNTFPTSEHAYHWEKFPGDFNNILRDKILTAPSAHEAFKIAELHKSSRRPDWDRIKVDLMRNILTNKARQHEYVRRKLLATGERELIEDSWRDDFWGWGPNRDGKNMLGKLWMDIRAELRNEEQQ